MAEGGLTDLRASTPQNSLQSAGRNMSISAEPTNASGLLILWAVTVVYVDEAYTSSKCPLHGHNCGKRIERGLFKCTYP